MKYLYAHIRKSNNSPFYIGVGDKKRPYNFTNRNELWKNEYSKHGCVVQIIEESSDYVHLYEKEKELIEYYGRINEGNGILTNISTGGLGSGGIKFTNEEIERRRQMMKNRQTSAETRLKMSLSKKGRKLSDITKKRMSQSHKKRSDFHSGFGKLILDKETGIFYGNIRLACEALNLNPLSIQKKIVRGKYNRLSYE